MDKELAANTLLSHYRILSKIGAGGMGEVYLAEDTRLDRRVAIKLLPADFAKDEDRIRRFEQEARATSALNHPNILTVYDIGSYNDSPYLVAELLEGEELRFQLTEGAIPTRKVIEYAQQIAAGLSAAHEKGIVHRDLKPENLFITKDDRVKILDFGLAKLKPSALTGGAGAEAPTMKPLTNPGVVMGTVGYMSPEQVRGEPTDYRSDIFSFGLILYEMITGRRAFQRDTMAETMAAILKEEPAELSAASLNLNPSLERIVRRCLEKKAERRFQSTADLGFALESLSAPTNSSGNDLTRAVSGILADNEVPVRRSRISWIVAAVLGVAVICTGTWYSGRGWFTPSAASVADVTYLPVTFERGFIFAARFAPDGRTIVFSADFDRQPRGVYVASLDSSEYRSLGLTGADLLAVSRSGELAILNGSTIVSGNPYRRTGTLARTSMTGGTSRPELEEVRFADFGPNNTIAVVRSNGGRRVLEYPVGQVLAETPGMQRRSLSSAIELAAPRVSPSGDHIAYFDLRGRSVVQLKILDRSGKAVVESQPFADWWAPAWRSSNELWFGASEAFGSQVSIFSLDLAGRQRRVFRAPAVLTLHDISTQGDVLVSFDRGTSNIEVIEGSDPIPRDRSWRESGELGAFSTNHTLLINGFSGTGGTGGSGAVYVWKPNETQTVRIAEGRGLALSPDGSKALVFTTGNQLKVTIVPTGAGQPLPVDIGTAESVSWAGWMPDGRVVIRGVLRNSTPIAHVVSATGRDPKPFLPDGVTLPDSGNNLISPDGSRIVAADASGRIVLCTIAAPACTPVPSMEDGYELAGWSADGKSLFVCKRQPEQTQVDRLDVKTGRRSAWKALRALNPSASGIAAVIVSPDGAVAYGYRRDASELCVIKGLR